MDKRYKILIGVLIAISALAILIVTSNSQNKSEALRTQYVTPSAKVSNDITPAEQLEQCKRYIVDNEDFPGSSSKECKGIQEDDFRLNVAYCANGDSVACTTLYGTNTTETTQVDLLSACKDKILRMADFGGIECKGIAEDDSRLIPTFYLMYDNMLKCIDIELDTGLKCAYGTETQQMNIYAKSEDGTLYE